MIAAFEPDRSAAARFFTSPIPIHDDPVLRSAPARILATWPENTFVENIHARPDGSLLMSVHSARELHRYRPGHGVEVFARLPASPTAINAHPHGGVAVLGGEVGKSPGYVWRVADDGSVKEIMQVRDAVFLNGGTPFVAGHLLAVDAILGRIYDIDLTIGTAKTWLQHERLTKVTPEVMLPGANGIKVFGGHVYVSNTDRALFLRVPCDERGVPGDLEVVAERLRADDFAFDASGTAYMTTHIHNSLLRLGADGVRCNVAGRAEGMAGSTAVAFGRSSDDARSVYVTTTGGVLSPIDGVVQRAKLVRIDVDATAHPIAYFSRA